MTASRVGQFSTMQLLVIVSICAVLAAGVRYVIVRTPHIRAVQSVNNRDGWAFEDYEGYVIAELNGYTMPITNESLEDLVPCKWLRTLDATDTQITDEGLVHLSRHEHLENLRLNGCDRITDGAIPYLIRLKNLRELLLVGTRVSDAGVDELRDGLPSCTITNGSGSTSNLMETRSD